MRPQIDYGDNMFDKLSNEFIFDKLESLQYKPMLAVAGPTHGISKENIRYEIRVRIIKIENMVEKLMLYV